LEPQTPDRETLTFEQRATSEDMPMMATEPNFLYSNRSYWYPQAPVSDYATATIRISVPTSIECVASGELEAGFPFPLPAKDPAQSRKIYLFHASQPLRYLAFIASRFARAETATIAFPPPAEAPGANAAPVGVSYPSLNLSVEANPRQVQHGREIADRA